MRAFASSPSARPFPFSRRLHVVAVVPGADRRLAVAFEGDDAVTHSVEEIAIVADDEHARIVCRSRSLVGSSRMRTSSQAAIMPTGWAAFHDVLSLGRFSSRHVTPGLTPEEQSRCHDCQSGCLTVPPAMVQPTQRKRNQQGGERWRPYESVERVLSLSASGAEPRIWRRDWPGGCSRPPFFATPRRCDK